NTIKLIARNPKNAGLVCIWGDTGSGKTHLLRAMTEEIKELHPELSVLSVRGEEFLNDYIDSIRHPYESDFIQKYYRADVLIIDGIEDLSGRDATQTQFVKFLYHSLEDGRSTVVSSAWNPMDLDNSNLLTAGLVERLGTLHKETLASIAKQELQKAFFKKTDEVAVDLIAKSIVEKFEANPRVIRGVASRVVFRNGEGENFDIEKAEKSIETDLNMFLS
ncbi:MAG: AAA family ATPase, partial [Lachnospiraceae bacterium]|nr:AAA family ATPase [Lachnospiraceae bacterium]